MKINQFINNSWRKQENSYYWEINFKCKGLTIKLNSITDYPLFIVTIGKEIIFDPPRKEILLQEITRLITINRDGENSQTRR